MATDGSVVLRGESAERSAGASPRHRWGEVWLERTAEIFLPSAITGETHLTLSKTIYKVRVLVAIASLGTAWVLPGATSQQRILFLALLGGVYIPYAVILLIASRKHEGPAIRFGSVIGDLTIVFLFQATLPPTRTVGLFGYLLISAFYTWMGGRAAGLIIGAAAMTFTTITEVFLPSSVEMFNTYELTLFAVVLISMAFLLDAAGKEQRKAARILQMDVSKRKETEAALRRAYDREREAAERLREIDEMRNAFLQAVSHDLRTPLTSILGFSKTLEKRLDDFTGEQAMELIAPISKNAERLNRLLMDLLDLDRLTRGVIDPQRRPSNVKSLAMGIVEQLELDGRGVSVDGEDISISVDPAQLERIIENLVTNAVRHTPEDASIKVRIDPTSNGVLLTVEDSGPGVPDEVKEEIFETFRQGDGKHAKGTGIGLSLVRRFAELHGGKAWVDDAEEGGASFKVFLPSVDEDEAPEPASTSTRVA